MRLSTPAEKLILDVNKVGSWMNEQQYSCELRIVKPKIK